SKKRQEKKSYRMIAKVGRDVADSQAAIGRTVVKMRFLRGQKRPLESLRKTEMFLIDGLSIVIGMEMYCVNQAVVSGNQIRIKRDRLAIGCDGVVELGLILQSVAQADVCLRTNRLDGDRLMVRTDCLITLAQIVQSLGQ